MTPPTHISADWLEAPNLAAVIDALSGDALFVGGCVRNTLLSQAVADIDLTTPLHPDEVVRRLDAAGLRSKPTGVEHGTVMAISDGEGFEITTYRADVSTDGRRATVRFSTDIAEDAARRDFTMNAVYARRDGTIIDPLGGLPDVMARRIRFINEPRDRIREDYLRILRFFRFTAWYGGDEGIEPEGLAACAELGDGIARLARERIGAEMKKLLAAPDPGPALAAMSASGVLMRCLAGAEPALIAPLVHVEGLADVTPDWRTRLAALGGEDVAERLRLSRAEARDLETIATAQGAGSPPAQAAHLFGMAAARSAALLGAATGSSEGIDQLESDLARGAAARFPVKAAALAKAGIAPGPAMGEALEAARTAWLTSDFALGEADLVRIALDQNRI